MKRDGFSLVELLTCIAIILASAAVVMPVLSAVKRSAKERACASNLKQLGLAVLLYQMDWDPAGGYGKVPDMGLPADPSVLKIPWEEITKCGGEPRVGGWPGPPSYTCLFCDVEDKTWEEWAKYCSEKQEKSVLFIDDNHRHDGTKIKYWKENYAFGIRLDLSLAKRMAKGDPSKIYYWRNEE